VNGFPYQTASPTMALYDFTSTNVNADDLYVGRIPISMSTHAEL
jgi:hypothetical protein